MEEFRLPGSFDAEDAAEVRDFLVEHFGLPRWELDAMSTRELGNFFVAWWYLNADKVHEACPDSMGDEIDATTRTAEQWVFGQPVGQN